VQLLLPGGGGLDKADPFSTAQDGGVLIGTATAFSYTAVSAIILEKSQGFHACRLTMVERLSCNNATSFSSPTRWRQRVMEERSKGSS